MRRNPGIQYLYRLEEIANAISSTSGIIQDGFNKARHLEEQFEGIKKSIDTAQKNLKVIMDTQSKLIEASIVTEFGLPSGMSSDEFEKITGRKITS